MRIDSRLNFEMRNGLITFHSTCLNLGVVLLDWPPPKYRKLILLCYLIHTWEREVERDRVMLFPKDISTKAVVIDLVGILILITNSIFHTHRPKL